MHQSQEGNTDVCKYEETGKKRHRTRTCDQCVKRGIAIVSSSAENFQKLSSGVRAESMFPPKGLPVPCTATGRGVSRGGPRVTLAPSGALHACALLKYSFKIPVLHYILLLYLFIFILLTALQTLGQ